MYPSDKNPPKIAFNPGEILGDRYRILRHLGHSDLGQTYLVSDLQEEGQQRILKEFIPENKSLEQLQKAQAIFERESRLYYQLNHPQIPSLPQIVLLKNEENQGRLFVIQNYIEGYSYLQLLKIRQSREKALNEKEVTHLLLKMLPVLDYIHYQGIIHGSICPNNVILALSDRLPVLVDFGWVKQLAKLLNSEFFNTHSDYPLSLFGVPGGKMGYAPPEQIQRGFTFPHSDLYALGATVMVLLTGQKPRQLMNPLTYEWKIPEDLEISPKIADILTQMLAPAPGYRFQSAQEVLNQLNYQRKINNDSPYTQPQNLQPITPNSSLEIQQAAPQIYPEKSLEKNALLQRILLGLGISFLLLLLILGAGLIGWIGGRTWVRQVAKQQENSSPINPNPTPTITPSGTVFDDDGVNNSEPWPGSRENRKLVRQLKINEGFFIDLVNQVFWEKNPEQKGQILTDKPEDDPQIEQWNTIAQELLEKLSFLSVESLRNLGNYTLTQQDDWKRDVNQLRLSSRALYDLADGAFNYYFSGYKYSNAIEEPFNQIWNAIVLDRLRKLQSGEAYERLEIGSEDSLVTSNASLKAGSGKAYSVYLKSGKQVVINLKTKGKVLLSVYTPTGTFPILEDSETHIWSGSLPETGFYEITVISQDSNEINYQLEISFQAENSLSQ